MLKTFEYSKNTSDVFENISKNGNVLLNHVIIPPGKFFPKHKTDAFVTVIIIRGFLDIFTEDGIPEHFEAGHVIEIPFNTDSSLGNPGTEITELFVIKIKNEV